MCQESFWSFGRSNDQRHLNVARQNRLPCTCASPIENRHKLNIPTVAISFDEWHRTGFSVSFDTRVSPTDMVVLFTALSSVTGRHIVFAMNVKRYADLNRFAQIVLFSNIQWTSIVQRKASKRVIHFVWYPGKEPTRNPSAPKTVEWSAVQAFGNIHSSFSLYRQTNTASMGMVFTDHR